MLMWVPGSLAYLATGVVLALQRFHADDRATPPPIAGSNRLWPTVRSATD